MRGVHVGFLYLSLRATDLLAVSRRTWVVGSARFAPFRISWLLLPRFRFQTLSLAPCDSSPGGKKGCIAQDSELRISPGARCSFLSLVPRASSPDYPELPDPPDG